MKKQFLFIILMPLCVIGLAHAQPNLQKGVGVVIFAEGDEFSIYRANALKTFAINTGTVEGLQVEAGDLIQTGPGTFVEIQLLPSQSVIKVAENTSFRMTGINTANGSTIDVIYGRIRAKVDPVLGQGGFAVRGKTAVAAVRGTEFGYDVVAVPGVGAEPSSQIYSFDGTVSVYPLQTDDAAANTMDQVFDSNSFKARKSFDVTAGQMVSVFDTPDDGSKSALGKLAGRDAVNAEGSRSVLRAPSIKQSIKNFWSNHSDQGLKIPEEEIQTKYYGLKVAKKTDPASTNAVPVPTVETVNSTSIKTTPANTQASLADAIAPIPSVNAMDGISPNQYALVEDKTKLAGIVLSTIGLVGNLAGAVFYNFGTDFGMTQSTAQTTGIVTFSISGGLVLSGLISYIIGLFQ